MGYLEDIPSIDEINKYSFIESNKIDNTELNTKDSNIEFNDEIEEYEKNIENSNIIMDV